MINFNSGNVSSVLVSEIVRTSKLAMTRSARDSNLFLTEFVDMNCNDTKAVFISKLLRLINIITRRTIVNRSI